MSLKNFLKLYRSECSRLSVYQEPYNFDKEDFTKTYFFDFDQFGIIETDTFKKISSKEVNYFYVFGSGNYEFELCVCLKED